MDSQTIIAEARGHLNAWRELPFPPEIAPSQVWHDHIAANLQPIQSLSADALVEHVTSNNTTSQPTATDARHSCALGLRRPGFSGDTSGHAHPRPGQRAT